MESFWKTQIHGICGRLPETFFRYSGCKPGSCRLSAAPYLCIVKQVGLGHVDLCQERKSECPGKDEDKLLGIMPFRSQEPWEGRKSNAYLLGMHLYTYVGI